ncbi:SRPBCC family protein [Alkalimonas collagenimarina]|uniref:SRPBCC family protein n=1 Tax=Alkalimonas collagenimarina TaxID=400390 RepID=A0ABT9H168_9GAMM|nr:SRPBCC family protein [Alkalimonas collagenimarina]MDP4537059.1 SRPBCC family protein [Alkalimonas collagenimarina]
MASTEFVYVTYIDTTPEQLWQALTSAEFTRQYWGERGIESSWQVGAAVQLLKENGSLDWSGRVLEAAPPKRLSYTFDPASDDEMPGYQGERVDLTQPEKPSRVTFEIEPYMGKVKLTLTHDQFEPGSKVLPGISNGWPVILSGLKSLLESQAALFPDWR